MSSDCTSVKNSPPTIFHISNLVLSVELEKTKNLGRFRFWYVFHVAQRSFFRTFEFYSRGSKQFGPPPMESDWYNLAGRLIEIILAEDVLRRCEKNVRKANTGFKKHGIRATVLSRIASCEEEGDDYPNKSVSGPRVDRAKAWEEWIGDSADTKELISGMCGLSQSMLDGCVSKRELEQNSDTKTQDSDSTIPASEVVKGNENIPTDDTFDEVVEEAPPPSPKGAMYSKC